MRCQGRNGVDDQLANEAYATWSEFYVQGQWKEDVSLSSDSMLEQPNIDTPQFLNSSLSCYCDE
jgi:hypothetical protein